MRENLPPLNAVRAFEQAGRHHNIARAAQELGVSAGAVSQQIAQLEKWIGCKLFRRNNRGLEFTNEGLEYYAAVSTAFGTLRAATSAISRPNVRKSFVVSVTSSFAMKWLMPRLQDFREKWPDIEISVKTTELFGKFEESDGDVGIRYGTGDFGSFASTELAKDKLVLVASKTLVQDVALDEELSFISCLPLLVDRHPRLIANYPGWAEYLKLLGMKQVDGLVFREFSQQWMVIAAAINGEGAALVKECLVADDLSAERVTQLTEKTIELETGYHLVHLPSNSSDPVIRSFKNWLRRALKRN
ncbi:LysR family transcriptional regulator [Roseibium denhamense]|uniref:Transcriptional regulator, LysR family n=1 Tax=Roseibium denhamense TaxID=76305 RepID=A0ABY1NCT9_9HYPH|nr:LysR substrate-binding domain-containing protein [Roseibium denhamense]MTI06673.1 LysR family transcriptional regulator [Roseibium denhamense]SMP06568.1 transcriptional regulator, LysR family [Roseibium denhamense]